MSPRAHRLTLTLTLTLIWLAGCFALPDYVDGKLRCYQAECPPAYHCHTDGLCYRAPEMDASVVPDVGAECAAGVDKRCLDGRPQTCDPTGHWVDADACPADRPTCDLGECVAPCAVGTQRCSGSDIQRCDATAAWQVLQTCGANGCFDPDPPGGTDQACGRCPVNARRCAGGTLQTCGAGDWQDAQTCTAFGCYDPDGESGPEGYCGTCAAGDKRCSADNLETCTNGQFLLAAACTTTSQTCFDPPPTGGTDAYCGVCVNNAKRCSLATLQVCISGAWMDSQMCGSAAACLDPDGDDGPGGSCSTCVTGNLQCSGSVLETCQGGTFVNTTDCAASARQCIDPLPQGGTDAYCGVCLNGAKRCLGTGLQVCTGGAWTAAQTCDASLGCFDPDGESGSGGYCRMCTDNDTRCANGNLETCVTGLWVPRTPTCSSTAGDTCFDPAPAGGGDAYCGNCLKGADRCTAATPPVRQTCPNGRWVDSQTCTDFGCYDPSGDGSASPPAYCGVCTNGDRQCGGLGLQTLQTCASGQFGDTLACGSVGQQCFDPGAPGGSDAYCGVCPIGAHRCTGDNLEVCNAPGSAWTVEQSCTWGCDGGALGCCAAPECDVGQQCGLSLPNACGKTQGCGDCGIGNSCCADPDVLHCLSGSCP